MRSRLVATTLLVLALGLARPASADDYQVDDMHTAVTFKLSHLGLSWTHGRFNEVSGTFTIDPADPAKCAFNLAIKAESVDTGNAKRDSHLKSPDFLNVKQFPAIAFKSTAVKAIPNGYEVTGEFSLHGVTKPLTFKLVGGRTAEFPKGVQRTGYSTELAVKRSDFGVGEKFGKMIGDDVYIAISFEGVKK